MRALHVARALPRLVREQRPEIAAACDVAEMLAGGFGVPPPAAGLLAYVTDRWDGQGPLRRARGEQIPLPMRIVSVAMDGALQSVLVGPAGAAQLVRERAGKAFDPEIATCLELVTIFEALHDMARPVERSPTRAACSPTAEP